MTPPLVRRTGHVLRPDPTRVVTTVFLPGQEAMAPGNSRATAVVGRVLALSEAQVERTLAQTLASFGSRHDGIDALLEARFELIAHRVEDPEAMSQARRRLVGAYFSQEYAVESAALFNPSMVAHPDQSGLAPGSRRFLMSIRAVGEGHISSIGWRTGTIDAHDHLELDVPGRPLVLADPVPTRYAKAQFLRQLEHRAIDGATSVRYVLAALPDVFDRAQLEAAMATLQGQDLTRGPSSPALEQLEQLAAAQYTVRFPAASALDQRVLLPGGPAESRGLEDLRLVVFTEPDGTTSRGRARPAAHHRLPHLPQPAAHGHRRAEQGHGPVPQDA